MRVWEIFALGAAACVYFIARILPSKYSSAARSAISHMLFSRSPSFDPKRTVVPQKDILQAARAHAR
jgi:hypothetical protein